MANQTPYRKNPAPPSLLTLARDIILSGPLPLSANRVYKSNDSNGKLQHLLISKLPRRQEKGRTEPPTTMSSSGAALKLLLLLCALASSVRSQSLDLPIRVIQKDVNSADEMKAMGSQQEAECGDLPEESDAGQYVKNLSTDTCAEKVQRKFKKTKRDVYLVHASLPWFFIWPQDHPIVCVCLLSPLELNFYLQSQGIEPNPTPNGWLVACGECIGGIWEPNMQAIG